MRALAKSSFHARNAVNTARRLLQRPARAFRAFFSDLHCVTSRSPYCSYCLRARCLCNLTEKCSRAAPVQRETRTLELHAQSHFVDIVDAIMLRVRVSALETVVHLPARVEET